MGSSSRGSGVTIDLCCAPSSTHGKNYSGVAGGYRISLGLRCLALGRTGRGGIRAIFVSDPFSLLSSAFVDGGDLLANTIGETLTVLCPFQSQLPELGMRKQLISSARQLADEQATG